MKQDYSQAKTIEGVKLTPLKFHQSLDGEFAEVNRFEGVDMIQWNHSILRPQVIKAFHVHQHQIDWWYSTDPLFVVLHDARRNSPTEGLTQRLCLNRALLEIPKNVWHGVLNPNYRDANLFYIVNNFFNPANPDEGRVAWDKLGKEVWEMPKE